MKFELKDYQEEAASKVLSGLRKGSAEYQSDGEHTAVSLSAPTGAGKTVIAAAVIERIFFGDPDGGHGPDSDAVFIWLTDDPSLNEQTRKKILEASDRIQPSHLITLNDGFDQPQFDRAKVYFLNIQKMGKKSNLVTRKEGRRMHTLWEVFNNSIKANGAHFYLIIDEAHRGTSVASREDQTITQKFLNGDGTVVPSPVVLGISATPQRFDNAVQTGAQERVPRKVVVPVSAVRESGLIKDVLSISYRGEAQTMATTLVRQAVANLRQMDTSWNIYTDIENEPPVRPALVLQIPPNANPSDVGILLDVCIDEWDQLGARNAIAHSLESHTALEFGSHTVPYVRPQDIQENQHVRVVIFKAALTTGWDCPRAEVMVSLRTAKDDTYIAQLIGRMVRSPLARRIQSDETLNRVRLYLPHFDNDAVETVKTKLESDEGGLPTEIEINSEDAYRNSLVPSSVFTAADLLPSYQVPGPVHRSQVARLHKLAALLIGDSILLDAIKTADAFLIGVMNTEKERLTAEGLLEAKITDIRTVSVEVMDIGAFESPVSYAQFDTDVEDVERIFLDAKRKFRDGLAERYWSHRVTDIGEDSLEAKILTSALSTDLGVIEKVEGEASNLVRKWLDKYGDSISVLSEDKKAKYAEVRAMAKEPELVTIGLPSGAISMSGDPSVRTWKSHLFSNSAGDFRTKLGGWEEHALEFEQARNGFLAWYRNPAGGQRSLRIPIEQSNGYGKLYPDFVVFHKDDSEEVRASIVDPHGHHLADAPDKLRGLSNYAVKHGASFGRIIAVIKDVDGNFRQLDLKDGTIQTALKSIRNQEEVEKLFKIQGSEYN